MAFLLVDILPLKPGRTFEEAVAYFDGLQTVFKRHGMRRLDRPLKAMKTLRGSVTGDMVNLFEIDNPETSLAGMRDDPDYQAKVTQRDAIFDLEQASIVLTQRT